MNATEFRHTDYGGAVEALCVTVNDIAVDHNLDPNDVMEVAGVVLYQAGMRGDAHNAAYALGFVEGWARTNGISRKSLTERIMEVEQYVH